MQNRSFNVRHNPGNNTGVNTSKDVNAPVPPDPYAKSYGAGQNVGSGSVGSGSSGGYANQATSPVPTGTNALILSHVFEASWNSTVLTQIDAKRLNDSTIFVEGLSLTDKAFYLGVVVTPKMEELKLIKRLEFQNTPFDLLLSFFDDTNTTVGTLVLESCQIENYGLTPMNAMYPGPLVIHAEVSFKDFTAL